MGAMVVLLGDPVVTAPAGTVREDAGLDDPVPPGPGPTRDERGREWSR